MYTRCLPLQLMHVWLARRPNVGVGIVSLSTGRCPSGLALIRPPQQAHITPYNNCVIATMAKPVVLQLERQAAKLLQEAGIPDAASSARWIREAIIPESTPIVSKAMENQFAAAIGRRLLREPVQYIIGSWDFDLLRDIRCRQPVLIPRPETACLIPHIMDNICRSEVAQQELNTKNAKYNHTRLLEVGCGSGAISLAVLNRSAGVRVTALDISIDAVNLTRENAKHFGFSDRIDVIHTSFQDYARPTDEEGQFDLLVSNPPYVTDEEYSNNTLQPEVQQFEDKRALVGGEPFGLGLILELLRTCADRRWLRLGSPVLMETHHLHTSLFWYFYDNQLPVKCAGYYPLDAAECATTVEDLAKALGTSVKELSELRESVEDIRQRFHFRKVYGDLYGRPRFIHLTTVT